MKGTTNTCNLIILTAVTGALTALSGYVYREMGRRGYPSWEECQCSFKTRQMIFPILHGRHEQRGETVFSQEWGVMLKRPPYWLRRFLHHSAQVLATLNLSRHYLERGTLNPQKARQFVILLQAPSVSDEDLTEREAREQMRIVWRREVLRTPTRLFDTHIQRLYPMQVSQERSEQVRTLPVLWNPYNKLPLPGERALLTTPDGTRIDYIGWSPSQVSYCTVRGRHKHATPEAPFSTMP